MYVLFADNEVPSKLELRSVVFVEDSDVPHHEFSAAVKQCQMYMHVHMYMYMGQKSFLTYQS